MMRDVAALARALMLGLLMTVRLSAQTIGGQVIDSIRHAPIAGALVELRNGDGTALQQMFTSASGGFAFVTATSGHYQLRIAAIGYARHATIDLAATTETVNVPDIILMPIAVSLPELHAMAGKRACGKSEVTPETFGGLLDGARTALQVMDATLRSGQVAFEVQLVHTITAHKAHDSTFSADTSSASLRQWPVRSLSPDSLQLVGFARDGTPAEGGGEFFYGPDLAVLFSDWFLESHCFTLDKKLSRGDTVYIRFDPAGKQKHIDISGQLVLDRATLTLQRMTYAHQNLPDGIPNGAAGGIMHFTQLSAGFWVPSDWSIWAPIFRKIRVISRPTPIYVRAPNGGTVMVMPPLQPPMSLIQLLGRDEQSGRMMRVVPVAGP